MPAKNRVKTYIAKGYYYIYNSGVDKRVVFTDDKDFLFFLNLLKAYLSPPDLLKQENIDSKLKTESPYRQKRRELMNLNQQIELLAFCLMPTHFQLLVKQEFPNGITKFMRRLITSYVTYFNKRHGREGNLFQGVYKGVLLSNPQEITKMIEHIHHEPISVRKIGLISTSTGSPAEYAYSSYHHYLAKTALSWLSMGLTSIE